MKYKILVGMVLTLCAGAAGGQERNLYRGDTRLYTNLSADAYLLGNRP